MSNLVITLPGRDEWKLERFRASQNEAGLDLEIDIWPGVIVDEAPEKLKWAIDQGYIPQPARPKKRGDIGAALAHITLWHHISKSNEPPDAVYLIFEDNCLFTDKSGWLIEYMKEKIRRDDLDFANLRVLRPKGKVLQRNPTILEMGQHRVRSPYPNVFLSSYMLTPRGARRILHLFKHRKFDITKYIIDIAFVKAIHERQSNQPFRGVVVKDVEYIGHIETKGDSRRKLNASRASNPPEDGSTLSTPPKTHGMTLRSGLVMIGIIVISILVLGLLAILLITKGGKKKL